MDRGGLPHSKYSIISETPFGNATPTILLFMSFNLNVKLERSENAIWIRMIGAEKRRGIKETKNTL